jgi:HPt (histidine-containing phosphotransfer) domain-containing protein
MNDPQQQSPSASTAQNPLDDSVLLEYLGDDAELRREVLQQFLDTLTGDLQQLESEIRESNSPSVQRSAHRLKGASYMVGARPLGDSAMQLESLARSGEVAGFAAAWTLINTEHQRLLQHLAAQNLSPTRR